MFHNYRDCSEFSLVIFTPKYSSSTTASIEKCLCEAEKSQPYISQPCGKGYRSMNIMRIGIKSRYLLPRTANRCPGRLTACLEISHTNLINQKKSSANMSHRQRCYY